MNGTINPAINIVITGAGGKMGQALLAAINTDSASRLTGAVVKPGNLGKKDTLSALGLTADVLIKESLEDILNTATVAAVIDFTRPEATLAYLPACIKHHVPLVIGTTGFTEAEKQKLIAAGATLPIVFSPNFSIGVNLTFALTALAARVLTNRFDTEIIEAHHRYKVDSPSGTALKLGEIIAANRHLDFAEAAVFDRHETQSPRPANAIGFASVRGGDIVGDHTVLFAGTGERIEITHKASSRLTFAEGALAAAHWLQTKKDGLYDMQDVLNLPA